MKAGPGKRRDRDYRKDKGERIKDEARREPRGSRRESEKFVREKMSAWKRIWREVGQHFLGPAPFP